MGMRIGNGGIGKKWEWENGAIMGMGTGMTSWEWEGMGTAEVIPAHL